MEKNRTFNIFCFLAGEFIALNYRTSYLHIISEICLWVHDCHFTTLHISDWKGNDWKEISNPFFFIFCKGGGISKPRQRMRGDKERNGRERNREGKKEESGLFCVS